MHFPTPAATKLAGVASVFLLLHYRLFVFKPSLFIATVSLSLLAATVFHAPPAAVSPAPLSLGAAPLCANGINRSTHSKNKSVWFRRSKAPPSLHVASDPFHYIESSFCCSPTSLNSAAQRSDLISSTTAANLRCNERGDISELCKVEASSFRRDSPTASINNRCPSPILTSSPFPFTPRRAVLTSDLPRAVVTSVEPSQAYASRVLRLHHYGLLRIPPTYSSILQYLVSHTVMEPEMKKVSTATTSIASFAASFTPRLVTGSTVQECGLAQFTCYYVTVAFHTHYAVSSIDGSSQYDSFTAVLVAKTFVQECRCARCTRYYVNAAPLSHYAVSSIDGSSQSQLSDLQIGAATKKSQPAPPLPCVRIPTSRRNTPKSSARRLDRTELLCFISDVCLITLIQNECDDIMRWSISVTNYWLRHGNVELLCFDPTKPFSLSSNSIVLSVLMKAKLAFEIHLVSLRSLVEFKSDRANLSAKSSHLGLSSLMLHTVLELLTESSCQSTSHSGVSTSVSTINCSQEQPPWEQK
ncbi:hypothetical protein HA466_0029380 [Hirschfeldia incana]|nr:hypothetical protein HA466_0029380 [Hirschfeldia incana]